MTDPNYKFDEHWPLADIHLIKNVLKTLLLEV
jgi:hypothetical protein